MLRVLLALLALCTPTDTASFSAPVLLGEADSCCDGNSTGFVGGKRCWLPGVNIAIDGLKKNKTVVQHITLSDDGGPPCNALSQGGHHQACGQVMVTRDGGITYSTVVLQSCKLNGFSE